MWEIFAAKISAMQARTQPNITANCKSLQIDQAQWLMWWVKFAPTFISCFYLNNSCLIVCLRCMCKVTAGGLRGNR